MPRTFKFSLCLAAAMVLCFTPAMAQDSARRAGLNGSILIKDHSDLGFFPQEATTYQNKIRVHTDGWGHSGVVLDGNKEMTWGLGFNNAQFAIGGPDAGGGDEPPTPEPEPGNIEEPGGDAQEGPGLPETAQMLDVFYARGNWGARLGVGLGGGSQKVGDADETSASAMDVAANFGMNMGAMDIGLALGLSNKEITDAVTVSGLSVGAFLRGYKPMSEGVELGYYGYGAFGSGTESPEAEGAEDTTSTAIFAGVGAGPVIKKGASTVAIEGELGFRMFGSESGDNKASGTQIVVPSVNAAFETPLNDWTTFRAGVGYEFAMSSGTVEQGDNKAESSSNGGDVSWATGLSAKWSDLVFDLELNKSFLVDGPYMISGQGSGLASNLSATYSW